MVPDAGRRADSGLIFQTSRVASMKSSADMVDSRPFGETRSNRPLLATITRSVRSRSTGLVALR